MTDTSTLPPIRAALLNTWIGREALLERLADRDEGMLTLHGPPGVGKTRFALECARRRAEPWHFVELIGCTSAEAAGERLLESFGVAGVNGGQAARIDSLVRAVARHGWRTLVFDGVDDVVLADPGFFHSLASALPTVRVLLTTRVLSQDPREARFSVPPLTVEEGAALYLARLKALRSGARVEVSDLAELVERLEGLPLAIELAAYRGAMLSPRQILERLELRFDLLRREGRDGAVTSLEAAIGESVDRLSPELRRTLVRCAVFSGGFDLQAAEHVVSEPRRTWDHLQELQERSLLTLNTLEATPRLQMLESIREYLVRFASERGAARKAHAAYFSAFALDRGREIVSPKAPRALAWFERERLNVRHALDWLEPNQPIEASRVALAMESFAAIRGNGQERRSLLDRAVRCAVTDVDRLRRRALLRRARFLATSSDAEQAARDVEAADRLDEGDTPPELLEIRLAARQFSSASASEDIDDVLAQCSPGSLTEARVLAQRGIGRSLAGDEARSVSDLRRAVDIAGAVGAVVNEAVFNVMLGVLLLRTGQLEAAERCLTACQPVLDAIGHRRMQPFVLRSRSLIHAARGETSTATEMLETALEDSIEMQDGVGAGVCRLYLGLTAWRAGEAAEARSNFETAATLSPGVVPRPLWSVSACLAALDALDGDQSAAERGYEEALDRLPAGGPSTSEERIIRALGLVVMSGRARLSNAASDYARVLDAATAATAASGEIAVIAPILSEAVRRSAFRAAERGFVHRSRPGLVVGAGGAWARLPDGEITDLRSRSNAQRLLWVLAVERVDRPGSGLDAEALFRLVWPGERADKVSRRNRVRVAVAELRKRGLRALLIRDATGYRVRGDVPASLERFV
ncbi:MAG: hypothetical protein AB8I08_12040 [Sandaracinaceae bacterium]